MPETVPPSPTRTPRRHWLGLAVLALGVSIIIVDATIANVVVPSIIQDLRLEIADAEWIVTIYSVLFAALLLPFGRLGDVIGRRRMFRVGLVVFVLASVAAGGSPTGGALIAARVVQGVGAAAILPATLASVNALFRGRDRAIAFGIWGSIVGGMAAFGPLLGGWLTTAHTWRWAFYVNVPIVAAVLAATVLVDETRDPRRLPGLDWAGTATSVVGLGGIVFALIEGARYGWWTPVRTFHLAGWQWPSGLLSPVPVALALGAGSLALFAVVEPRRASTGREVLLDLGLFRLGSFRDGNLTSAVLGLGEFGVIFVLPLFLQAVMGFTAFRVGLLLMSLALGAFLGGPFAAGMAHRHGPRWVVTIGMAVEAVAILAVALLLGPDMRTVQIVPVLFVYGIGVGLATAQLTNVILVEVPARASGMASGARTAFRQVGSALGIAIVGTVLTVNLSSLTATNLRRIPDLPAPAADAITEAVSASGGQALAEIARRPGTEPVVAAVSDAFGTAATRAALVADAFVFLGLLLSLRLPNVREAPHPAGEPLATPAPR